MGRGRYFYPKVKVICVCGWTGKRTTFKSSDPCPKCGSRPQRLDGIEGIQNLPARNTEPEPGDGG